MDERRPRTGGVLVPVLGVLAVVWLAALPLVVGAALAGVDPDLGRLRTAGGGAPLLHLLWIYPVYFVVAGALAPRGRSARSRAARVAAGVVETALAWLVLTVLLGVLFVHPAGAAIAAALAVGTLAPFARVRRRGPTGDAA